MSAVIGSARWLARERRQAERYRRRPEMGCEAKPGWARPGAACVCINDFPSRHYDSYCWDPVGPARGQALVVAGVYAGDDVTLVRFAEWPGWYNERRFRPRSWREGWREQNLFGRIVKLLGQIKGHVVRLGPVPLRGRDQQQDAGMQIAQQAHALGPNALGRHGGGQPGLQVKQGAWKIPLLLYVGLRYRDAVALELLKRDFDRGAVDRHTGREVGQHGGGGSVERGHGVGSFGGQHGGQAGAQNDERARKLGGDGVGHGRSPSGRGHDSEGRG